MRIAVRSGVSACWASSVESSDGPCPLKACIITCCITGSSCGKPSSVGPPYSPTTTGLSAPCLRIMARTAPMWPAIAAGSS